MARICVYLGSREGNSPAFRQATNQLGRTLAERGHTLVYGGARVGLMGELANAALEAGGEVIGVMPDHLVEREQAHFGLSELIRVRNMHERKATMAANADAFIALPGGIGTLEELFEIWTWGYLGLHEKPMGLLNIDEFYSPLLTFLDSTVSHGFWRLPPAKCCSMHRPPMSCLRRWKPSYKTGEGGRVTNVPGAR
ncbi:putative cytokinin riboside 5'-monophosphate phosphoribohydrolase [Vreelandella olivaria]|uniref:Cytokinin riboside 5'-monophosphate phosphoribohydrolase n=1 Tax=Vreelandella olivaria TaxID=390919 RepID=A0ABM7GCQ0_9GAMM|nr:putative cytokinin riboside 5'-monophosphate phosphoribohydrolase [Halomonas olivaria]